MMHFLNPSTFLAQLLLAIALPLNSSTISLAASPVTSRLPETITATAKQQTTEDQYEGQVPGRQRGGGRRTDCLDPQSSCVCPESQVPLTALVPAQEVVGQALPTVYVGGVTIAERPTFWFYVPYPLNNDLTAEFVLQEAGQDVYRVSSTEFLVAETPGIIRVTLPNSIAPLEMGKTYEWYFKVNCTEESPLFVNGGIQRIALDSALASQLATMSPREQVALYRSNNLWYDAITTLGTLQQTDSSSGNDAIAADWATLLESMGIDDVPFDSVVP